MFRKKNRRLAGKPTNSATARNTSSNHLRLQEAAAAFYSSKQTGHHLLKFDTRVRHYGSKVIFVSNLHILEPFLSFSVQSSKPGVTIRDESITVVFVSHDTLHLLEPFAWVKNQNSKVVLLRSNHNRCAPLPQQGTKLTTKQCAPTDPILGPDTFSKCAWLKMALS